MNQIRDGADLQIVFLGKDFEIVATRHGAVFVHNFNDYGGGLKASHFGHVTASFGVTCAAQYSARLGLERENMAWLNNVFGASAAGNSGLHCTCAIRG